MIDFYPKRERERERERDEQKRRRMYKWINTKAFQNNKAHLNIKHPYNFNTF